MIVALALLATKVLIVDGQPADVGPIDEALDAYVVPIDRAVAALSANRVSFRRDSLVKGSLVGPDGTVVLTLPIEPAKMPPGTDLEPAAHVPGVPEKIAIGTIPFEKTVDGKPVVVADIQEIAGWLGAGIDTSETGFEATSSSHWESMLGSFPKRTAAPPSDLAQDLGVSPPALTMVLWARARKAGWVQIYGLSDGIPEPMLGIDPLTGKEATGTDGILARPRSLGKEGSVRVATQHGKNKVGQTGLYVALFLRNDPGDKDPIEEIEAGNIKPEDYIVVGVRQKIGASPVIFKTVRTQKGENLSALAKRQKVDLALLRALNGLVPDEAVPPETGLVVPEQVKPLTAPPTDSLVVGTTYAKGGETLESLAAQWHVPLADALGANPGFQADTQLNPGELLTLLRPKPSIGAPAADLPKKPPIGTATVATSVAMRVSPTSTPSGSPLPEGAIVDVIDKVGSNYRIVFKGQVGFLTASNLKNVDVTIDIPKAVSGGPDANSERPIIDPSLSPVIRTALRYYGTPYLWGGNSLTKGIDCSHFVSAVFTEAGVPCPPPPVLSQESRGTLVHWKVPGMHVRSGGTEVVLPNRVASMNQLRPGDRVIIQRGLTDATGSRHTGIYAGRLSFRGRNYANAMIHASCSRGITVDEITASWIWKDYKFSRGAEGGRS